MTDTSIISGSAKYMQSKYRYIYVYIYIQQIGILIEHRVRGYGYVLFKT